MSDLEQVRRYGPGRTHETEARAVLPKKIPWGVALVTRERGDEGPLRVPVLVCEGSCRNWTPHVVKVGNIFECGDCGHERFWGHK